MSPRKPSGPPTRDRSGYYTLPDGTRCMSVTTIISSGIPKPALMHWAAIEVARCAVDHLPRLVRVRGEQAREEAFQWLRYAAERKRDTAADLGGTVHDAVEAKILDKPMPEPTDEQQPYLDAFERFCVDWSPRWECSELTVANPADGWAGKLDWAGVLPALGPAVVLGDWKTGKGIYGDVALQLSAYRRPTVAWLPDGTQVDPPATERAYVVHLRPEKYPERGYAIYPVDTSDEVYASFLAARDVALGWMKGRAEQVIGDPLDPTTETEVA